MSRAQNGADGGERPGLPARTGTRRRIYPAPLPRAAAPRGPRRAGRRRGTRPAPSRSARASCGNRTWRGRGAENHAPLLRLEPELPRNHLFPPKALLVLRRGRPKRGLVWFYRGFGAGGSGFSRRQNGAFWTRFCTFQRKNATR